VSWAWLHGGCSSCAAEFAALPLPRDGRAADLLAVAGLYRRLGLKEDAKRCLADAVSTMRTVYWACDPSSKAAAEELQRDVEKTLAEM